jgi:hypothetical protein
MNEGKVGEQIRDGHRADTELIMLGDAFTTLKAEYVKAWEATSLRDNDGRERLWQAVQIVGKVESHLRTIAANGRVAQKDMDRLRSGKTGIFS